MSASSGSNTDPERGSIDVRWSDVIRFVRQLSHDLRNHLNAIELQSAFLAELTTDAELQGEIKRLRQMVSEFGNSLQKTTTRLNPSKPSLLPYEAKEFMEHVRSKLAEQFPKETPRIQWHISEENGKIDIDVQSLPQALVELFTNGFEHLSPEGTLRASAGVEGNRYMFSLTEPKTNFELATENWGREPLRNVHRGHYGLGLHLVRSIVEAQGGEFHARYDSKLSELTTTISFPLLP
ncbi:MAG: hypothetical protein QOG67_1502 [Verrucomicrobiota bacterium]|jgi:signal transduction histidine kinase